MPIFSIAQVESVARDFPENLLFFSTKILMDVASDTANRYTENCKSQCLAELVARWCLNLSRDIEACLDRIFPEKEWHALFSLKWDDILFAPTAAILPDKLWTSQSPFLTSSEITARKRLTTWLDADGFIPVYSGSEAFFLPFSWTENQHLPLIGDAAGQPIANWQAPFLALFGETPKYRCLVHCHQQGLPELKGNSLMLPLYLSYQRKTGELPAYNRLRLLSTGAFDEAGRLKAVATEEKQQALGLCFNNAFLFFPESTQFHSEDRGAVPLRITLSKKELLVEIQKQIEAKGLVIPTFADAKKRLPYLELETRHENVKSWEDILARLQTNKKAISPQRDPETYLLCLMLESVIYCHNGKTAEALKYNAEAKRLAKELKREKQLLRLSIEELVDLQDMDDFQSVETIAKTLQGQIEHCDDNDLLMRYYGTMGQAHCYGYLAGCPGFEQNTAKEFFQKALQYAYKTESELDIAQDLNYNYLWYVLFDPASKDADSAYQEAYNHIKHNLQNFPESQKKNKNFLRRFKLQARYRRLLSGDKPEAFDWKAEELPEGAFDWLRALVCKYLGAIAAAYGEVQQAASFFHSADQALVKSAQDDNIKAFIRMTILAEAFRSLHEDGYREKALDALKGLSKNYAASVKPWQDYLSSSGASDFPGLAYWY